MRKVYKYLGYTLLGITLAVVLILVQNYALQPKAYTGKADAKLRQITWQDLVPAGWKPPGMPDAQAVSSWTDSDPRAVDALAKMRQAWTDAPVVPALNGAEVRIAGYIIPLERDGDRVSEFLLVPSFGACIHVPPPPPNQIIYVKSDEPLQGAYTMQTLWVSGRLSVAHTDSPWGQAAYQLQARLTEPY